MTVTVLDDPRVGLALQLGEPQDSLLTAPLQLGLAQGSPPATHPTPHPALGSTVCNAREDSPEQPLRAGEAGMPPLSACHSSTDQNVCVCDLVCRVCVCKPVWRGYACVFVVV